MAINLTIPIEKMIIRHPVDVYQMMQLVLQREDKLDMNYEHFWVLALNAGGKVLNLELVSMGSTRKVVVEPMQVLRLPLLKYAIGVMLVHNHPSGVLTPSKGDKDVTDQLIQACRIMKTPVLDHVIITQHSYYSFKESGLLEFLEGSLKYVPKYELERQYHDELEREKALILQASEEKIQASLVRGRKIGMEIGTSKGKKEGLKEGEQRGLKKGKTEGLKEGRKEGKAEGRKEGREEEKRTIARQMLDEGLAVDIISKVTGLKEAEIQKLAAV